MTGLQQLQRLFKQAGRRHVVDQRRQTRNRLCRFRADAHIELGGETHGAQHAHGIFTVARFRRADQANQTLFQVLHAADVVAHGEIRHAVIQAVDGEVATLGIFFNRAEDIVAQQHTVLTALRRGAIGRARFVVAAEGRHFDNFRPKHDVSQTETTANETAVAE